MKALKSVKGEKNNNSGQLTTTHFAIWGKKKKIGGSRFSQFFEDLGSVPEQTLSASFRKPHH